MKNHMHAPAMLMHSAPNTVIVREINKIFFNAWLFPQLTCLAINGFPAFILMFLGGDFFTELLGRIPESFVNALSVTGNIL